MFVTFLDGHELVYFYKVDYPNQPRYYLEWQMEDVELKPKQLELVKQFFDTLIKFNFVHLTDAN